jgi:hypothetical protein
MNTNLFNILTESGFPYRKGKFYTPVLEHLPLDYHLNLLATKILEEVVEVCFSRERQYYNLQISTPDFSEKNIWAEGGTACNQIVSDIHSHFGK